MKWSFKWRKALKSGQYYDLIKKGMVKPEDMEPCIDGLEFYIDAYRELSTSRPSGLEIQSIPFTAMSEYFRIYELHNLFDFDEFAYIIRRMDNTSIELNESASKAEKGKNAAKHTDKNNKTRS